MGKETDTPGPLPWEQPAAKPHWVTLVSGLDRERPCSHGGQGLLGMASLPGPLTGSPVWAARVGPGRW